LQLFEFAAQFGFSRQVKLIVTIRDLILLLGSERVLHNCIIFVRTDNQAESWIIVTFSTTFAIGIIDIQFWGKGYALRSLLVESRAKPMKSITIPNNIEQRFRLREFCLLIMSQRVLLEIDWGLKSESESRETPFPRVIHFLRG
jgi:hypothetical protein